MHSLQADAGNPLSHLCEYVQVCCGHRLLTRQQGKVLRQDTIQHLRRGGGWWQGEESGRGVAAVCDGAFRWDFMLLYAQGVDACARCKAGVYTPAVCRYTTYPKESLKNLLLLLLLGSAKRNSSSVIVSEHQSQIIASLIIPNSSSN